MHWVIFNIQSVFTGILELCSPMSDLTNKAPKVTLEESMVDFTLSTLDISYRKETSAVRKHQLAIIMKDILKITETFYSSDREFTKSQVICITHTFPFELSLSYLRPNFLNE